MLGDPDTDPTSNGTRIAPRRLEGRKSETRFSFRKRGRQHRTPKRDPRERSEQWNPGSRADDWRTRERNTLFVSQERTTTSDPQSAILASGASNGTQDRAPTIGGRESETRFSFRERGRQRRTPKRDPRERSEQWSLRYQRSAGSLWAKA